MDVKITMDASDLLRQQTTTPSGQTCASGICTDSRYRDCTCFFGRLQVSEHDNFNNGNLPGVTYLQSPLLNNCSELLNEIGTDGGQNKCYQTSFQAHAPCFCDKNVTLPSNTTSQPAVQLPPCNSTQCVARSFQYCFCNSAGIGTSGIVAIRPIPAYVTAPFDYCYKNVSQPPDVYCYNNGQFCSCEPISGTDESQCVCRSCYDC